MIQGRSALARRRPEATGAPAANASSVAIEPLGNVVAEGQQTIKPENNTVYTLKASNSYGIRGVQLGVSVTRPSPGESIPQATKISGKEPVKVRPSRSPARYRRTAA